MLYRTNTETASHPPAPYISIHMKRALPLRRSLSLLAALLAALLGAAACASAGGAPPDLSDTRFERSLQVDLATMTRTPSGLYYQDLTEGRGDLARARRKVTVRYTGWLVNGTKVDSSEGLEFLLGTGKVIRGWDIGVEGMREGGVRKLVIPPELGYRYRDVGVIPAGSVLVFQVELLRVRP